MKRTFPRTFLRFCWLGFCLLPSVQPPATAAGLFDIYDAAEFNRIIATNATTNILSSGLGWIEGPVWVQTAGHLIFSDVSNNRLYQWSPVTGRTVCRQPATTLKYNGNTLDLQGRLISCQAGIDGRCVVRTESDGTVVPLVSQYGGWQFNSPNDVVVKSDGSIWFTDPDYDSGQNSQPGRYVYCFWPTNGNLTVTPVATNLVRPNGLCFSPDESLLYVVDSDTSRQQVWVYEVQPDNTLRNGRVFCTMANPDGVRCDIDGRLWASSNEGIRVYGQDGHWIGTIRLANRAANLCFGDADWRTLYMVAQPNLYSLRVLVPGATALRRPPSLAPFAVTPLWRAGGHARGVTGVAWSPDGTMLATADEDATVKLWQAADGALLNTLSLAPEPATCLAFSPDAALVAAGNYRGSVNLWRTTNHWAGGSVTSVRTTTNHLGKVCAIAFDPRGGLLASAGAEGSNVVQRASDGQPVARFSAYGSSPAYAVAAAFSSRGLLASGCDDGTVRVWNTNGWSQAWSSSGVHASNVTSIAFAPDGSRLASAGLDGRVVVRSVTNWNTVLLQINSAHTSGVTALCCSLDGSWLASGSGDGEIRIWNAASGVCMATRQAHVEALTSLAFSPDGQWLATGSRDSLVKIWRVTDAALVSVLTGHAGSVTVAAVSPDGSMLASAANDRMIFLRRAIDGALLRVLPGHADWIRGLVFSPDGLVLASYGGPLDAPIKLWRVSDGALLQTFAAQSNGVTALAFSPNGSLLAAGGDFSDKTILLLDATSGALARTLAGHSNGVTTLAFSPTGDRLASGGRRFDHTVKVWDLASGALLRTLAPHSNNVETVAFSPDGATIGSGCAGDGWIRLWRVADGSLRVFGASTGAVTYLSFSPDGAALAAGGPEGAIQIWNVAAGTLAKSVQSEALRVTCGGYSPDGSLFAFGREDGTVVLATNTPVILPFAVTLLSPTYGSMLGSQPLNVTADATAPSNNLALVELFLDGVRVGQTAHPLYDTVYSFTLNAPPGGYHTFFAGATDTQGHVTYSAPVFVTIPWPAQALVTAGSTWKYDDKGSNTFGNAWRALAFDDRGWSNGAALLGFGDINGQPPTTQVASNRQWTTYFRQTFTVADPSQFTNLTLRLVRDDGAVVYVNGTEVWRSNITNSGPIAYNTPGSSAAGGADESRWWTTNARPTLLVAGTNLVAVEVHQNNLDSSDLSFDFQLQAESGLALPTLGLARRDGQPELSWPAWAGGLCLWSATNLAPPATWSSATNAVHNDGAWLRVPFIGDEPQRYFQLRMP